MVQMIPFEAEEKLDWLSLTDALSAGHARPKAEIGDTFLYRGDDTLLSRAAWIDGMGSLVKTATIFPSATPSVNGGVNLYSDTDGTLEAIIDFHLVTKWKTCGDSLLAARLLARPDSDTILIVGAGTVAKGVREAYGALFPKARFLIWNRTTARAEALAQQFANTEVVDDLKQAVGRADIVTSATMRTEPLLDGAWFKEGQHIDLIGAYRPDMREANDAALVRARVFVDSFDTTIGHIGEINIPLEQGTLQRADLIADYYDLPHFKRNSEDEITLFKNGGGAHLDLMTSRYILDAWSA
ncbi:ornithine cyclodeaminase family protein [Nereida sp. MMG025]|uniref:ornithine cyclodeaminase family protein n=1 Tax=Nereida sp. MMG025 TaxID=2909981 RepID=UPI001F2558DA|nr:ornithine cyclodeaminase [Nereida sp. MMG025]MCF6444454.1 ornithine cyclodeaminase [Nereida sp. MMG025]